MIDFWLGKQVWGLQVCRESLGWNRRNTGWPKGTLLSTRCWKNKTVGLGGELRGVLRGDWDLG